jgi:acyl-CoA thioester hydrolase
VTRFPGKSRRSATRQASAGSSARSSGPSWRHSSGGEAPPVVRRTRIRVRYAETDRMAVVYYANYFVWFEVGRTEWLRETGATYREMERDGVSLPVIEAHAEYRRPAEYDDDIEISTSARLVTPVRIRFDYEVWRAGEERPLVTGYTVHAGVDRNGRPCRLPDLVRNRVETGSTRT